MKTKLISLILCVLLVLTVFSACSKSNDEGVETTLGRESTSQLTSDEKNTAQNGSTEKEDKTTTKKQTTERKTTEQVQPLTSAEALELLEKHYGKGFTVNGRVQDGDFYSYHIIKDNQKYASVKVNLKTRQATETLTESGKESHFAL